MSDKGQSNWREKLRLRAPAKANALLLLLVGFGLGALTVGLLPCADAPASNTHQEHAHEIASDDGAAQTWTCAMHPQIRKNEPGQCPICGMDLIPVNSGAGQDKTGANNRVVLSPRARALAQLRTTEVRRHDEMAGQLRLLGRVEPNETTLKTVTAWTGGRIDRLYVNATGQQVNAGQPIATLYSPEVFAAHQDLIVAKRQVERMQQSPTASQRAAQAALDAARQRIRLLGVPDRELSRMEAETRPTRAVTIRTPFSGTVIERLATEGAYVSTGTPLYRIANLGSLWVQLDAYESDLANLELGQHVQVTVEAVPDEKFTGKVTFIEPTLDAQRRTAKVRVQVDNHDGRLRPGMFAEATVATQVTTGEQSPLVIPASAPLFTGRRAIVYVEVAGDEQTVYEATTVRLGPKLGDYYPVVAGLAAGDRVVTRGAFALDADLQIRGGTSMMTGNDDREAGAWDDVIALSPAARQMLSPVVSTYLDVQAALADDDLTHAKTAAQQLVRATDDVVLERPHEAHTAWSNIAASIGAHARHVAMANSLEAARAGFEPLSGAIIQALTLFGNPLNQPLRLAFCPMASGSDGAQWVQRGAEIDNAYFGASMLTCGEVRQEIAPGGFLKPTGPSSRSPETSTSRTQQAAPAGRHSH